MVDCDQCALLRVLHFLVSCHYDLQAEDSNRELYCNARYKYIPDVSESVHSPGYSANFWRAPPGVGQNRRISSQFRLTTAREKPMNKDLFGRLRYQVQ
jgi:hypothetical protein